MRYSHKTTHTFEVRSFSRPVPQAKLKLGLLAVLRRSHCSHFNLYISERADQLFSLNSFPIQPQIRTEIFPENALASRARMAVKATTGMMLKPAGTIADVGLTRTQSNREVTKTNVTKTPYPDAQPHRVNRKVVAKINFGAQTSTQFMG
jgi:hypothetical protein